MGQSFNTHHAVVLIALAGWYKFYFRNRTTLTSSDACAVGLAELLGAPCLSAGRAGLKARRGGGAARSAAT